MNFIDSKHRNLLILANCEVNLQNKDVKTAIEILKNVEENDSCYKTCRLKLADIYLNKLKQSRSYIQCFMDIVEKNPNKINL